MPIQPQIDLEAYSDVLLACMDAQEAKEYAFLFAKEVIKEEKIISHEQINECLLIRIDGLLPQKLLTKYGYVHHIAGDDLYAPLPPMLECLNLVWSLWRL